MLSPKNYNLIVIKIGGSLLYSPSKGFNSRLLKELVGQVSLLKQGGKEVVIVSSGAIALGMHVLGWSDRPKELHRLQAAAAIGQNELIEKYRTAFKGKRIPVSQVLLTWDDFSDRTRYLNAKNTFCELLKYGSVPVVNENDTVSTEEIRFGDNDRLSAMVASLIKADLLIILTDVEGLLERDQKTVVRKVAEIDSRIRSLACPTRKKTCVGGMITKIEAAKIAVDSGVPCVIADGRKKDLLLSILLEPENHGTLFLTQKSLAARERWMAFGSRPKGRITVDEGASRALQDRKSLLSVGIVACEGLFEAGDIVSLVDIKKNEFARGKAAVSCRELERVKGKRFSREVVHRDNIVLL